MLEACGGIFPGQFWEEIDQEKETRVETGEVFGYRVRKCVN